jgi:hypothetical protein
LGITAPVFFQFLLRLSSVLKVLVILGISCILIVGTVLRVFNVLIIVGISDVLVTIVLRVPHILLVVPVLIH